MPNFDWAASSKITGTIQLNGRQNFIQICKAVVADTLGCTSHLNDVISSTSVCKMQHIHSQIESMLKFHAECSVLHYAWSTNNCYVIVKALHYWCMAVCFYCLQMLKLCMYFVCICSTVQFLLNFILVSLIHIFMVLSELTLNVCTVYFLAFSSNFIIILRSCVPCVRCSY